MSSGIYKILNIVDGKFYIGSAVNFKVRFNTHRKLLRKGKHKNKYLQAAYNKYGVENFEFVIIELCEKNKLLEREQFYFFETDCCNREVGYNLYAIAGSPLGTKWSDEQRFKFLESNKNFKHTEEAKAEMSKFHSNRSAEYRANISDAKLGHFVSEETKAKIGKANSKPNKWPHGYVCKCEECRELKNSLARQRRRVTFTMVDINV